MRASRRLSACAARTRRVRDAALPVSRRDQPRRRTRRTVASPARAAGVECLGRVVHGHRRRRGRRGVSSVPVGVRVPAVDGSAPVALAVRTGADLVPDFHARCCLLREPPGHSGEGGVGGVPVRPSGRADDPARGRGGTARVRTGDCGEFHPRLPQGAGTVLSRRGVGSLRRVREARHPEVRRAPVLHGSRVAGVAVWRGADI